MMGVDFSPNGQWLAVGGAAWEVARCHLFEVATGRLARNLVGHSTLVFGAAFSRDGMRLATAGHEGTARVWSVADFPEFLSLEGHDHAVWALAFSRDGKKLASGSLDQTARVWDAASGAVLKTLSVGFPVVSLAFSPDGDRLVTVGSNRTAMVWNVTNGQPIRALSGHTGTVMAVAWSQDGRWILTGSKDGTARLWEPDKGIALRTLASHTNWVLNVAFSPDGRRVVTGSADNTARIWELNSGRLLQVLAGHREWILQVAFSPDGGRVATGSLDRQARLWNADTGRLLFTMEAHRAGITSLGFSPDGARLATAGAGIDIVVNQSPDPFALIWDVQTGQRLLKLDAHDAWVVAVAFSPDGRRLATGSLDNTIRIREAFPWKSEDYASTAAGSLGERVELFKRRYWQERMQSASSAVPLGAQPVASGRRWQNVYASRMNVPAEGGTKTRPAMPIPPRDIRADANLIDLTACYNAALTESWQPSRGFIDVDRNLSSLPVGVTNLAGVPFDVRGLIRLSRAAHGYAIFPNSVEIAVGRKFRRLHVLHGTVALAKDGQRIGTYRLHYREGSSTELPILYGRDVRDWWMMAGLVTPAEATEPVWAGPADQTRPAETPVRLFKSSYDNPAPEREITRITFESTMTTSAPFLIAMTVEP